MNILILTPWYPDEKLPHHGKFIRDLAAVQSKKNKVVIISCKIDYAHFGLSSVRILKSTFGAIQEHRLLIKKSLPFFNQIHYFLSAFMYTLKIARTFRPDIIHGHIGYAGGVWSCLVSKKLKIPFVLTEHTRLSNNFRSFWHKRLTLWALRGASRIITVGSGLSKEIANYINVNKISIIPNPIGDIPFEEFSQKKNQIQIGFLGGLNTPVKGLDVLLQALKKLNLDFTLHVGGAGLLLEKYQQLALSLGLEGRCHFYGFVKPEEIPQFMKRLHFFVCASRYETFGIVLLEALFCGTPVIATRCGGPEDFVTEACGILCEKENPDQLATAIQKMTNQWVTYNPINLRNYVLDNFSPQKIADQMDDLYRLVILKKTIK